jgi:hypothetical protein
LSRLPHQARGHQLRWTYVAITFVTTGTLASTLTFYGSVFERPSSPRLSETEREMQPGGIAFSTRFPEVVDFGPLATRADLEVQRAKLQLAQAMRSQSLSADDVTESSKMPAKVPLPRVRPVVTGLMANIGAVSLPEQVSGDPLSKAGTALRKVFAMLQPSDSLMASASPDGGISSDGKDATPPTLAEKQAALYDISARTVYMPDGTRLEAHSGLGALMDDPTQVHVRNRGATPPQVYELTMRERPFHGVEALRMKPVGQGDLFGRSGLLTHSYLMGPNGDSNGCVSFKDYAMFVEAYKAGAVKLLIVVPSLADSAVVTAQKS